ncbi:MAG: hypothetical protein ABSD58_05410 [Verrucomicrobiia bacterium]|jgi:hypothetical protein
MTFSQAKQEFQIRYYLWATSEFEREIDESFPSFRSFKAGAVPDLLQFMQQLNKNDQLTLAHGLLKRFHPDAVRALGESCSDEEESLRAKRDAFHVTTRKLEAEIRARKDSGETITFASKRKLRKVMTAKFKDAFGSKCLGLACVDEEPELGFKMKCCGWILHTDFWFGRRESLINYGHGITSETTFEYRGNQIPTMILATMVSLSSWLGITSQAKWEYLMDEDVEPACDAVIGYCGHFFEVLPKLLKGLEAENVTAD